MIVHSPLVSVRFGDGLDRFRPYRERGLRIDLGTDTAPPDMIHNMQVGLLINRFVMKHLIIPGVDEKTDTARAQRQFDGPVERNPDRTFAHPPVEEIFRPSYPVVRAG